MSSLSQENRYIAIGDFSLGQDTFLLTGFEGSEHVSDLFEFQITVISENLNVAADSVVGKSTDITIQNDHNRVFNGYISSFSYGEIQINNVREYHMTMVPWLWFLSKTNNHRIFQDKNTKDIVSQIFQDLGFNDFDFRASGGQVREYCVQHNESDLNFVSRLLEEEGIAYFFIHEEGKHKLILIDEKNAYDEVAESNLEYSNGTSPNEQITRWEHLYDFKKGQWSLADYNFKEPNKKLYSNTATTSTFADNSKYEHYEYPSLYEYGLGGELVKVRMEAEEASINRVLGSSDCTTFYAGSKFKVGKHDNAQEKGEYILISVHHRAYDTTYFSGESGDTGYINSFVCIPSDVHYRPPLIHQKPFMRGPQSAIVTGPSGEEIYVDDLGRIKVQFYWDREGNNDENTSCFIRVMQAWAGAQWGASFIPRIGHEVIVDFIDGDPDRPIITGTVYNGKNKPPFDSKTKSGIRTRSTKDGSAANCNELIFDDKKDAEQILIHAEKNLDTVVENDESLNVEHNRAKNISNDEVTSVGNNRSKEIGNDQTESVGNNNDLTVGNDHSETVGKNATISIGDNLSESIGKNMTVSVSKDLSESIGSNHTESVTKAYELNG